MKKYLLLTCLATLAFAYSIAKETRSNNHHQHLGNSAFGNDVIIQNPVSGVDQTIVKLTTAFNGWQYAAFSTVDIGSNMGGITLKFSKDNGSTWTMIDSYSIPLVRFPALDIVVAGTDTNDLVLYNVGVNNNLNDETYTLFINNYDGRTGSFIESNYNIQNAVGKIYDVAIASDYAFPAVGASPYSVGVLYSASSDNADSIIFIGSVDGGSTWSINETVMSTTDYFRKVSLAYGQSPGASNGLYFGAWEVLQSSGDLTGHILTSRCDAMVTDSWTTPVDIDPSTSSSQGRYRNPSMAVSAGNIDNDSSSVTALVLVDYDFSDVGTDFDIIGFYNKVAHLTDYWTRLNVEVSNAMTMQSDIIYHAATSSFLCTYFDATNNMLPYLSNDLNLTDADGWILNFAQYNDNTAGLTNALPQISADSSGKVSFAWIQNNVALFDREDATVSVPRVTESGGILTIFPNPAVHNINVGVSLKESSRVNIDILNSLGQLVVTEDLGTLANGISNHSINIDALANGNYFVRVTGERFVKTEKIVIVK